MKAFHALMLIAALSACAPTTAPRFVIEPIQIDQIDILVMESFPVQVSAHITGVVGDGCASFHAARQVRQGNIITLTLERKREQADVCTQLAQLYDETLRLEGEFPAGDYTLKVNGVEKSFRID